MLAFAVPKWLVPAPAEVLRELWRERPRLLREGGVTAWASLQAAAAL